MGPSVSNGDEDSRYISPRFLISPLFGLNLLIGACVRVNDHVFALLRRLNLIYLRWYAPFTSFLDSSNIEMF